MRVAKLKQKLKSHVIGLYIAKIVRVAKHLETGAGIPNSLYIAKIVRVAKHCFVY